MKSFRLAPYAVTNRQYAAFLSERIAAGALGGLADVTSRRNRLSVHGGVVHCAPGYEEHPATYVSWRGANAYCDWLRQKTGIRYRLPTETEWQYAAMGPRRLKWSLGDDFDPQLYVCRCEEPAPVTSGRPTDLGFFNMTGNVFEWCEDEYRCGLGGERANMVLHGNRVIKGGAFILGDAANYRNAKRFSCDEESCIAAVGFRVAAD